MTTSMILRDGSIVGGARGRLPPAAAQTFTAAVRTVLTRWTALRLAVEGGWGGPDSDSKAGTMVDDVVGWFRDGTEHYADELEDELAEAMLADFGAQLEDDSPREVARTLVQIYHELGNAGISPTLAALLAKPAPPPLGNSLREELDRDGTVVGRAAGAGRGGGASSSDEEGGVGAAAPPPAAPRQQKVAPVVDEDGFTTVVRRR